MTLRKRTQAHTRTSELSVLRGQGVLFYGSMALALSFSCSPPPHAGNAVPSATARATAVTARATATTGTSVAAPATTATQSTKPDSTAANQPQTSEPETLCPDWVPPELAEVTGLPEVHEDDATPPGAALQRQALKGLTAAQRAEALVLSELCEVGVANSASGKLEVGCTCCPPFYECPSRTNALPRRDVEYVYPLRTKTPGSFTSPAVQELAATFDGCEPHAGNYGGTVLYRKVAERWQNVAYTSGLHPARCQPYRRSDGRDVLICEWSDVHQGTAWSSVLVYDFAGHGEECWTELESFTDFTLLCETEPGMELTWAQLDSVKIQALDADGIADIRIEGRRRQGLPSERFTEACVRQLNRDEPATPREAERIRALLGPLEHVRFDFISDGYHFKARAQ